MLESSSVGSPKFSSWANVLSLYNTPLSEVIGGHTQITFHLCADDTQLYIHLLHKNTAQSLEKLQLLSRIF